MMEHTVVLSKTDVGHLLAGGTLRVMSSNPVELRLDNIEFDELRAAVECSSSLGAPVALGKIRTVWPGE